MPANDVCSRVWARISHPYEALKPFFDGWRPTALYVAQHDADDEVATTHCHIYAEGNTLSNQTIKNHLKRAGVEVGRGTWMWRSPDDDDVDNTIKYILKGTLQPCLVIGSFKEPEYYHGLWQEPVASPDKGGRRTLTQYRIKIESPKEAKLRQNDMIEEIIKRVKESDDWTPRHILELIRQVVVIENKTVCGRYKIRDFYDIIQCNINKESWLTQMENFVCYKT